MSKRGFEEDEWISAFNHFVALVLGGEVLRSVQNVASSSFPDLQAERLDSVRFGALGAFDTEIPLSVNELSTWFERKTAEFEHWVNNARHMNPPTFLPGTSFVKAIISNLQQQIEVLRNSTFFAFIDEYENLAEYQQRLINTWVKHSQAPLIFNLAIKRNGFQTRQTIGNEYLSDIHDFRTHDLEEDLQTDFQTFAAEILFLNLSFAQLAEAPVDEATLRDPRRLPQRREAEYRKRIMNAAEYLFPDKSYKQIATEVFDDQSLLAKLRENIRIALQKRNSQLSVSSFVKPGFPQASIVAPVLLHREALEPQSVADEMEALTADRANKFTGQTEWIGNNFVGALLHLYEPHSRPCPFYAGFETFCHLSRGNLRHFLELCHKSIYRSLNHPETSIFPVTSSDQSEAARQASAAFLGEVKSFGRLGNRLHTFVYRLGTLFQLAHQRPSQSETEQSHFAITRGSTELTEDIVIFLNEAVKWSVLFEEKGTKKKEKYEPEGSDYILNPIYAPYFHISYRKKRKLELRTEELTILIRGSFAEVKSLLNRFSKDWEVNPEDVAPSLFGDAEIRG